MKDLSPDIFRQRLLIEGLRRSPFSCDLIVRYLQGLCLELDMTALNIPETHESEKYGWSAWMHWETSGVHFYSWDKKQPAFFSVDIYTCKKFDVDKAVIFTRDFLDTIQLEWKDVKI